MDTGDSLYYYMNTAEEENVLILKIDINESEIKVFDANGEELCKAETFWIWIWETTSRYSVILPIHS